MRRVGYSVVVVCVCMRVCVCVCVCVTVAALADETFSTSETGFIKIALIICITDMVHYRPLGVMEVYILIEMSFRIGMSCICT